jgi:hypothetical protein
MFEQGEAEGLHKSQIPDDYVTKFSLRDDHDVRGLIENLEGVGDTKYRQGYDTGFAAGAASRAA